MKRNLIILGNGFDLSTDKKIDSTFNGFIHSYYKDACKICERIIQFIEGLNEDNTPEIRVNLLSFLKDGTINKDSCNELIELIDNIYYENLNFNIWIIYCLLHNKYGCNWSDIEFQISQSMNYINKNDTLENGFNDKWISGIFTLLSENSKFPLEGDNQNKNDYKKNIYLLCFSFIFKRNFEAISCIYHNESSKITNRLSKFLIGELNDLEINFNFYLLEQLSKADSAKNKAHEYIKFMSNNINNLIINFNYTDLILNNEINNVFHIHGELISEEQIVKRFNDDITSICMTSSETIENITNSNNFIGDIYNNMSPLDKKKFSEDMDKLFRNHLIIGIKPNNPTIFYDNKDLTSTLNKLSKYTRTKEFNLYSEFKNILNKSDCNSISFFGHSLSEIDYDYFFEIFDSVGLDKSYNINMTFYYKLHSPSKSHQDVIDQFKNSIFKMLLKYTRGQEKFLNNIINNLISIGKISFKEIKQ